jgi:hypothetical protein
MGPNTDENADLFDNITSKDIREWQNSLNDEQVDQCEKSDVDEEEEIDEKDAILESILLWLNDNNLTPWCKNPPTAVKIVCRVSVYEGC